MADTQPIQQGIDSGFVWQLMDGASPADLTSYTVKSQLRSSERITTTNLIQEFTAGVIAGGKVFISWTAEQSLLWNWDYAYFDVILYWPDGRPRQTIATQRVSLIRAVTHA